MVAGGILPPPLPTLMDYTEARAFEQEAELRAYYRQLRHSCASQFDSCLGNRSGRLSATLRAACEALGGDSHVKRPCIGKEGIFFAIAKLPNSE